MFFQLPLLEDVLLASSGQRPAILWNTLQCPEQSPIRMIWSQVLILSRSRDPATDKSSTPISDVSWKSVLCLFSGLTGSLLLNHLKISLLCKMMNSLALCCLSYLCPVPNRACARLCWEANGVITSLGFYMDKTNVCFSNFLNVINGTWMFLASSQGETESGF